MKTGITIRRAMIDDLASICALSQLLFEHDGQFTEEFNMSWSRSKEGQEFFTKQLKSRKSFILLAQDGNKSVGYTHVTLDKFAWRAFNPIAEVVNLSIAPEYRGQGIGTALFHEAKTLAKKRGAKRMSVSAVSADIRALNFYKRHGFKDFSVGMVVPLD
ncbi:MAG TPA: GNAT family N-acetyltransferase [Patescibacteria group bacterium]|jgi:ribosomal protein S18 acetylase RimI-like enzyme|nr:GNAT family N-acetyltransferase [Patescibacteria group bacterium]